MLNTAYGVPAMVPVAFGVAGYVMVSEGNSFAAKVQRSRRIRKDTCLPDRSGAATPSSPGSIPRCSNLKYAISGRMT